MPFKIILSLIIVLSQAISFAIIPRRAALLNGTSTSSSTSVEIKIPDDVTDYTSRLKDCYYIKQNAKNGAPIDQQKYMALNCDNLSVESKNMHYVYYTNQTIMNYINKYEKLYPLY